MSILVGNPFFLNAGAGGAYEIERSLRFNSSDSAYLSRVVGGSATTFTISCWVKLGKLTGLQTLFGFGADTYSDTLFLTGDGRVSLYNGSSTGHTYSTALLRDPSAWYHFLVKVTSGNPVLYVNGSLFVSASGYNWQMHGTNNRIGAFNESGTPQYFFDGYIADFYCIENQALDPSSFTETSATTGQLIPKAYSGSFGTNGFWLKFSDNSAATATTLGKDYSGNSNNWTPNNLSVTAGAGNDSLTDTPTSYGTDTGAGGEVRGNYCIWNPISRRASSPRTVVNGNLDTTGDNNNYEAVLGTIAMPSGKWYWELTIGAVNLYNQTIVGIASTLPSNFAIGYGYYSDGGQKVQGGTSSSYGASFTTGDVVGIAFNADDGSITFYKNGASQGIAFTSIPSANYFPCVNGAGITTYSANFGQRQWAYAAPAGFKALCDQNLPAPTIARPSTVMDVKLYTGNGSTQSLALSFSPDFLWFKARSDSGQHALYDIIRGASKSLVSNSTAAEATEGGGLSTFDSAGFSLSGDNTVQGSTNGSGRSYVAWAWDAGSSTVTNTQGSITSQVRANASAGFSIVTYTGTGANATVGHGLGIAPGMIIIKDRDFAYNWQVYHQSLLNTQALLLNTTAAAGVYGSWNSTSATSSVFSLGSASGVNEAGRKHVAYCFAPVAGYSSFGSYTGNGSADGPFVYTGFRPRWVILKNASAVWNWQLRDTARDTYNPAQARLFPNTSDAESTNDPVDILANGFKIRVTGGDYNGNGNTFIWAAFAENPFQYARAR